MRNVQREDTGVEAGLAWRKEQRLTYNERR